jgi:23S rRNA A2030 N6-methylase RlmJ
MPYDHSHKAGNKGDVWKHFALLSIIDRLPATGTFRYVDTHAGAPSHELGPGGEWEDGVGRVLEKCAALRGQGYIEIASRWAAGGRYPSSWRFAVEGAARRFEHFDVYLSDIAPVVATQYADPAALGLPGNVTVHFHLGDGFARLESLDGADLVLLDPSFSPRPDVDWSRLRQACVSLLERDIRFLAWYPIVADKESAELVADTGCSASEVVWTPLVPDTGREIRGCGVIASRECGDALAARIPQLEVLASCVGGRFRRWAHGL